MSDTLERWFVLRDAAILARAVAFLQANYKAMADAGRPLSLHIAEFDAKRTKSQNNRYWHVLQQIADQAWANGRRYSREVWHEEMRRRFLPMLETPDGGLCATSTTVLSVKEFSDYIDQVEEFACSTLGCEL
jgi:hypothetical protein